MSVNKIVWSRDRIMAYKNYLQGNRAQEFRGKKRDGTPYKNALLVSKLMDRQKSVTYSVSGGKLMADDGDTKREVLSPEAVESLVKRLYKNKAIALGKAPSIYNWMKIRYVGFGYKQVEKHVKSIPEYQKYQARHLQKKKSRTVIIARKPGAEIDADLMFFRGKYYDKSMNDNHQGLLVVVDRFSGYIDVRPINFGEKQKSSAVVAAKMEQILRGGFPRSRGATIFTDNGAEFQTDFQQRMQQLGYNHVIISQSAGAPSPHAERAVGIIRKLVNQKLSANAKPKAKTQRWWPLARTLVKSYNDTPMTDARAPKTPNQLKNIRGQRAAEVVGAMQKKGAKRLKMKGARDMGAGVKVQKGQEILTEGDYVRVAVEQLRKTGANRRPFPKQRWSTKVYRIARVVARKLGYAKYIVQGLPKQRWEREDLQKVRKPKAGAPVEDDDTAKLVAKQASKRAERHA